MEKKHVDENGEVWVAFPAKMDPTLECLTGDVRIELSRKKITHTSPFAFFPFVPCLYP